MTATVTPTKPAEEFVDQVECSYCDTPIVPEVEDFESALQCPCGSWHHYDCAESCTEYVHWLAYAAAEDAMGGN